MNIKSNLWMVKYRPQKIDEIILPEDRKQQVRQWLETGNLPHLIFIGPPGCGKTSLANVIIKTFNAEVLEMNASDERSIETMRTKVKDFAMVSSNKLKIVFMDEADGLLPASQEILRNMMETYAHNTRFILTGNKDRFIGAIKDRCVVIKFRKLSKDEVMELCKRILNNEKVEYDESDITKIIEVKYPSLRAIINVLQSSVIEENGKRKLVVGELESNNEDIDELFEYYKNGEMDKIFKIVRERGFDNYEELFREIFIYHEKEPLKQIIIAEYLYRHSLVSDKDLNFYAMLIALKYGIVPTGIFYDGVEKINQLVKDKNDDGLRKGTMKIAQNKENDYENIDINPVQSPINEKLYENKINVKDNNTKVIIKEKIDGLFSNLNNKYDHKNNQSQDKNLNDLFTNNNQTNQNVNDLFNSNQKQDSQSKNQNDELGKLFTNTTKIIDWLNN